MYTFLWQIKLPTFHICERKQIDTMKRSSVSKANPACYACAVTLMWRSGCCNWQVTWCWRQNILYDHILGLMASLPSCHPCCWCASAAEPYTLLSHWSDSLTAELPSLLLLCIGCRTLSHLIIPVIVSLSVLRCLRFSRLVLPSQ